LTENDFILFDRIEVIKKTIEKYGEENFYISFSGGKDSTVLHHLIDEAISGNQIPRVFMNTGIEYNDIRRFVEELTEKLRPCPFCGGEARIQVTDDEGNLKSDSYLESPYSGVGYVIVHDISNSTDCCPIATNSAEIQGRYIYTSKQEAIDAWNKRVNDDSDKEKENG